MLWLAQSQVRSIYRDVEGQRQRSDIAAARASYRSKNVQSTVRPHAAVPPPALAPAAAALAVAEMMPPAAGSPAAEPLPQYGRDRRPDPRDVAEPLLREEDGSDDDDGRGGRGGE